MTHRVVAIDGPAGTGKSTVSRAVGEQLGVEVLDTGSMYRAVAYAVLRDGVEPSAAAPVAAIARTMALEVGDRVLVDGVDASAEIRGPAVTQAVSAVAANPDVRHEMVTRQRKWLEERGSGVVEGRDIGTVVCPDAPVKIFLTASDEVRALRRHGQERGRGGDRGDSPSGSGSAGAAVEDVRTDLTRRDTLDATRAVSPLQVADDAVVIDTSELSVDDVVARVMAIVREAGLST